MEVTADEKAFAKSLATLIGGQPSVHAYWDEAQKSSVSVMKCEGAPKRGLSTHCTLTLHRNRNALSTSRDMRVELITMNRGKKYDAGLPLSTAAFCVINSKWPCFPGAVFPDVYAIHRPSAKLRHALFCPPIPWDEELGAMQIGDLDVHYLTMVPISDAELRFAEDNGSDELEKVLATHEVDFAEWNRDSIL